MNKCSKCKKGTMSEFLTDDLKILCGECSLYYFVNQEIKIEEEIKKSNEQRKNIARQKYLKAKIVDCSHETMKEKISNLYINNTFVTLYECSECNYAEIRRTDDV